MIGLLNDIFMSGPLQAFNWLTDFPLSVSLAHLHVYLFTHKHTMHHTCMLTVLVTPAHDDVHNFEYRDETELSDLKFYFC